MFVCEMIGSCCCENLGTLKQLLLEVSEGLTERLETELFLRIDFGELRDDEYSPFRRDDLFQTEDSREVLRMFDASDCVLSRRTQPE